jgi:hypothetical protein
MKYEVSEVTDEGDRRIAELSDSEICLPLVFENHAVSLRFSVESVARLIGKSLVSLGTGENLVFSSVRISLHEPVHPLTIFIKTSKQARSQRCSAASASLARLTGSNPTVALPRSENAC